MRWVIQIFIAIAFSFLMAMLTTPYKKEDE